MSFTVTQPLRQTKEALTTEQMRKLRPFLSKLILDGAGQVKQGAVEDVLRAMVQVSQGASPVKFDEDGKTLEGKKPISTPSFMEDPKRAGNLLKIHAASYHVLGNEYPGSRSDDYS